MEAITYQLFAGYNYYPASFDDYVGNYETKGEAVTEGLKRTHSLEDDRDWYEVIEVTKETSRLVAEG